jgi:dTDP-4-dehydrorhamnose reductase
MGASMVVVSAHTIISRAATGATLDFHENLGSTDGEDGMRLLVTGASGQLGSHLLRELRGNADLVAWSGSRAGELLGVPLVPVDLANPPEVVAAFRTARPEVVIHCAALSRIADCYRDPAQARRVNVTATAALADECGHSGARLVFVSTDLVFDGERGGYREDDLPAPLSVYGRTKHEAEALVLSAPRSIVARVSLLYGPSLNGRASFFDEQAAALRERRNVTLFTDEWRTPLDLTTAARALAALAASDMTGIFHVGGPERLSRYEMGLRLAAALGADASVIVAATRDSVPPPEPRPRDTSLNSSRCRAAFPSILWPRYLE